MCFTVTWLAWPFIDACSAASYARPSHGPIVARLPSAQAPTTQIANVGGTMQDVGFSASTLLVGLALVVGACTGGGTGCGGDGRQGRDHHREATSRHPR